MSASQAGVQGAMVVEYSRAGDCARVECQGQDQGVGAGQGRAGQGQQPQGQGGCGQGVPGRARRRLHRCDVSLILRT